MKRNKINKYIWLVVLFLLYVQLCAQGPPIVTDTPIFLGLEGRGARTYIKYISKENTTVWTVPLTIPYNLTTDLMVGAVFPFISKSTNGAETKTGAGDLSFFAKYLLVQNDYRAKTFRIALKIKETFPTGETESAPPLGIDAYRSQVGLIGAYITTKLGLYSEIGYTLITNQIPDQLNYNFAVGYPLLPVTYPANQVNLYLELNGGSILNKKRQFLFISPGIQVIPGRKFLTELGVQIPITEDMPENTNIIYRLGIRILIF